MELIYRGTRDGSSSNDFHNKCDNKGESIILIKNDKDNIFGGYTSYPWGKDDNYHSSPDSFLFTLTNIYNINPTKFPSKNDQKEVYHRSDLGPVFGGGTDLGLYNDFLGYLSICKNCNWQNTIRKMQFAKITICKNNNR